MGDGMRVSRRPTTLLTVAGAGALLTVMAGFPAQAASAPPVSSAHSAVFDGTPAGAVPRQADGSPNTYVTDVDCVSASFCMATANVGQAPQVLRWNGSAWAALSLPGVKALRLQAVSCTSATACMVTGAAGQRSVAEEWNGSTWRKLPDPGLFDLSCVSMTDCAGIGGTQQGLMAYGWNGSAWTMQGVWSPGGPVAYWGGVTCVRASFCMAVGSGWVDNDEEVAFADDWNGSQWNGPLTVAQTGDVPALSGVSCPSAADCVGVGSTGSVPMSEKWNGTAWRLMKTPDPGSAINVTYLQGVSCPEAARCVAVGSNINAPQAFAEQLNDGTWTAQAVAKPDGGVFAAVSCASVSDCLAVGWHDVGTNQYRVALTERWNGSTWQVEPVPATARPAP